jgi:hypothetical protein
LQAISDEMGKEVCAAADGAIVGKLIKPVL